MKKLLFWLLSGFIILWLSIWNTSVVAQGTTLEIIPEVNVDKIWSAHNNIIDGGNGSVRDRYDQEGQGLNTEEQFVSGIMTRDTLLDYGVILLKRLSQAGIAVGWLMFIYVGYQYIMSIITGTNPETSLIKNAIIGILVIIFSYAIMRILTRTFLI